MPKTVILSSPVLLEDGMFRRREISRREARRRARRAENFSPHPTVRLLGVAPAASRRTCDGYDVAIVAKPKGRLEFGRQYSLAEIEEIGATFLLIEKLGRDKWTRK